MIQAIERLAVDMGKFAPELTADPKKSLYRIYRDTRFSGDKTPLKTNAAAVFPPRGFPRHEGAGLYFEVAPGWTWIGGGLYMPPSSTLHAIRARIASSHPRLHRIVTAPAFKKAVGELNGDQLTRVPVGYAKDHPAAHYLRFKQYLGFREFPADFATKADFYPTLLTTFKAMVPLLRFVNDAARSESPTPLTFLAGRETR